MNRLGATTCVAIAVGALLGCSQRAESPGRVSRDMAQARDAEQDLQKAEAQGSYNIAAAKAEGDYELAAHTCESLAAQAQRICKHKARTEMDAAKEQAHATYLR
jgi:hypothetical protein